MPMLKRPDTTFFDLKGVQDLYNHERNERVRLRLKAIMLLMEGDSQRSVAVELGCSAASVRSWTRRWNQGGYRAILDISRGSWTTNISRETARSNGFELRRDGSYWQMVPLAVNPLEDENGQPVEPIWFQDWDRPSKSSLRSMLKE